MLLAGLPSILAQKSSFEATFQNAVETALTPFGAVAGLVGLVFLALVVLRRDGAYIGGTMVVLCMTMMALENKYFDNTLFTPLQQFRDASKIVTVVTLAAMAVNMFVFPVQGSRRALSFTMLALLAFETFYLARLFAKGEGVRAGLGWVADILILITFGVGFASRIRNPIGFDRTLRIFTAASACFVALNVIQLVLGYRNAIAGSRFAGISANPQLAGYVSAVFLLFHAHLFGRASLASFSRYFHGFMIGALALFIVWSGSRTSALAGVAGLLVYYRIRLGSLALFGLIGGVSLMLFITLFGDSVEGISRFLEGENTRREIWGKLIADFRSAPVFGIMNQEEHEIFASESSYFTTLSLMGLSGAVVLAPFLFGVTWTTLRLFVARSARILAPTQVDLVIAMIGIMMVGSVFEGFFLGILSFAVVWIYFILGLASATIRESSRGPEDDDEDRGFGEESDSYDEYGFDPDEYAAEPNASAAPREPAAS
jgi:hypothetical protein